MNQAVLDKAEEAIKAIASKLGMAADHFYPIIVRQQVVEPIIYGVLFLCAATFLAVVVKRLLKFSNDNPNSEAIIPMTFLTLIVCTATIMLFMGFVCNKLPCIFNPEYCALKEIMNEFK